MKREEILAYSEWFVKDREGSKINGVKWKKEIKKERKKEREPSF